MLHEYKGTKPDIDPDAVVTPGTHIVGDVKIGPRTSVWFGAVIRGDVAPIAIGHTTSVQDNVVIHCEPQNGVNIGNCVTIGHSAVLHACTVEDNVLIGMGSTVLDGAHIGMGSIIAAGAVVTPGTKVAPFSLVAGVPGKVIRQLDEATLADRIKHAEKYHELSLGYARAQER